MCLRSFSKDSGNLLSLGVTGTSLANAALTGESALGTAGMEAQVVGSAPVVAGRVWLALCTELVLGLWSLCRAP